MLTKFYIRYIAIPKRLLYAEFIQQHTNSLDDYPLSQNPFLMALLDFRDTKKSGSRGKASPSAGLATLPIQGQERVGLEVGKAAEAL